MASIHGRELSSYDNNIVRVYVVYNVKRHVSHVLHPTNQNTVRGYNHAKDVNSFHGACKLAPNMENVSKLAI